MTESAPLRIATRASDLALWQANYVADRLRAIAKDRDVELVKISTHGDRVQTEALHQMGGVGVFTREVQKAVLDGRADIAVHSLKDLPTQTAEGLVLAGIPERASVYDALVLPAGKSGDHGLDGLPQGAKIGSGSLRRQAQIRAQRPDCELLEVRGNVPTRLQKVDEGHYDALILAVAGLERLGLGDRVSFELRPPDMLPAVGQGALGIECRDSDAETIALLEQLTDPDVRAAVTAERALLAELEAGCHAPLGVFSQLFENQLALNAVVFHPDGSKSIAADAAGDPDQADAVGRQLARKLLELGAGELITPAETE